MRTTDFLLATLRETPSEADIISHKLMLRAGMIRQTASGIYTWLPLGLRVLKKVENIIREEMDKIGALEILMPAIQPAKLWLESGRWNTFGDQLLKIKDRHNNDFCFGPTHEEVITYLARQELRSYKQLPLVLYQIQNKFRDEIRPRFGVMRGREFLMKDAYSFHLDMVSLQKTYDTMYEAYKRIFSRLGLKFCAVLADTGNIGGKISHEFQVLAQAGEDLIAYSNNYAANIEMAECFTQPITALTSPKPLQELATPKQHTVKEVAEFLQISPAQILKTLLVKGTKTPWVALVLRGDHELNITKAQKLPEVASPLTFLDPQEFTAIVACEAGFVGPLNLQLPIIADNDAMNMQNFVCGANKNDTHFINVNWQRDLPKPQTATIRKVQSGDLSPDGKDKLQFARGIEVGQIFQLGKKYSLAMHAAVLNATGQAVPIYMGCYGIGVSRTVAAAIEQNNDIHGIIWPNAIAPFQVVLIPMSLHKSYRVRTTAEEIYQRLLAANIEVLFDDRKERAGVLFADTDLIGIPHRIVISESSLEQGMVEYKARTTTTKKNIPITMLESFLQEQLQQ